MLNPTGDVLSRCTIFYATVLATREPWQMQCDKKPQLLQKIQIQVLAAEFWWRGVKKWEVATMSDILTIISAGLWTDIMEQQHE